MKKLLFSAAMLLAGVSANAQLAPGSVAPNFTVTAYQSWLSTAGTTSNGSYTLYDYLDQGYTVFLDVSATWCGPCRMMAPHIEALKEKYKDQLTVLKVDTDKSTEVSQYFRISGIPLVKLYKDGKEVYDKTGYHSQEELQALLGKYL